MVQVGADGREDWRLLCGYGDLPKVNDYFSAGFGLDLGPAPVRKLVKDGIGTVWQVIFLCFAIATIRMVSLYLERYVIDRERQERCRGGQGGAEQRRGEESREEKRRAE